MVTVAVSYGIDDVSQSSLAIAGHTNLVASALGILSIVIPKLAVAILLVRLLNPTRTTTVTLIGSSVIAIVLGILVVIVTFAQCKPTASLWDPNLLQERVCWNPNVLVDISFVGGGMVLIRLRLLGNRQFADDFSLCCVSRPCFRSLPCSDFFETPDKLWTKSDHQHAYGIRNGVSYRPPEKSGTRRRLTFNPELALFPSIRPLDFLCSLKMIGLVKHVSLQEPSTRAYLMK